MRRRNLRGEQRLVNLAVLMDDQIFEQSLGHVDPSREADFPGFLVEDHVANLVTRFIEFFHRRLHGCHRLVRRGQRLRLDGRTVLRQCQRGAEWDEKQEAGNHDGES